MNKKARVEMVRAMDTIARSCNDEEVLMYWLSLGVADGDCEGPDEDLETYFEDDEDFSELMGTFLKLMSSAKKSGGLYCDRVCSK